ncbi:MAG: alpha-1,2-fucosyltransferase [Bacteroidetes bacterium]|nr:alpha-1,2-fucosyltransferase [Bacteroidota bacterium]
MIFVKIQGGIGNQLFQLALAIALKKRGKNVELDTSFYKSNNKESTYRKFYLDAFSITDFSLKKSNSFFRKLRLYKSKKNIYTENSPLFNSNIFNVKSPAYIIGYFQSYKYFESIELEIKRQLTLNRKLTKASEEYKNLILSKENSVSLHIRRGDYQATYAEIYCNLEIEYYKNAVSFMKNKMGDAPLTLFVFSDDIMWCKNNFTFNEEFIFIENSNSPDYEDLMLMSYCNHNIIANSTYSWWSAWLNNNEQKIVVAPNKWFNKHNEKFIGTLYPKTWNIL